VTLGIVSGGFGAVLSLEMRYRGFYDFVLDSGIRHDTVFFALTGLFVALFIGVAVAIALGIIYGLLLNRVKGSEMAISVYVGFSAIALFNIVWALIPVTSSVMIFPGRGEGLRMMINLQDDFQRVLDNILGFNIGAMFVSTGLLIMFFVMCLLMYIFTKSKLGMKMSSAGANPAYARASGINVDKMRILGTTISTALGAFGFVIYAQSFGFLQLYNAPLMFGFMIVASVMIGGASVKRARVFDVLLGAFLFNGILAIALPLSNQLIPEYPGLPEMLRLIISNGIILYALTRAKGGR
jgi:simple sugar transport system permease protein